MKRINEYAVNKLLEDMLKTYKEKDKNYGSSFERSLDKYGLIAALVRISDKFNRAENIILKKENGTDDESLVDTLIDMANYCVMTASYLRGDKK